MFSIFGFCFLALYLVKISGEMASGKFLEVFLKFLEVPRRPLKFIEVP